MKKEIRIISLLLAILLLSAALASCGGRGGGGTSTASTSAEATGAVETEPADQLEARKLVDDELGNPDLQGKGFRIATYGQGNADFTDIEEATGDVLTDSVFERNSAIEERFNVEIVSVWDEYEAMNTRIPNTILAGDDAFDLVNHQVVKQGGMALQGCFMNLYEIPNIDFSKPWWAPATMTDLTYKNVAFIAVGDFSMSALSTTYCVLMNKKIAADYGLPEMYDVVHDGKWTIDYIAGVSKEIYDDVNGNGIQDDDDLYGYITNSQSNANTYIWAFDNPVIKNTGDELEVVFHTDKIAAITEKLVTLFWSGEGMHTSTQKPTWAPSSRNVHHYNYDMFYTGHTLFANGLIGHAASDDFRNMEDDYSILPYPKWDEVQENYYTMADGSHTAQSVPMTATDYEFIGIMTEVMNAETYKQVVPVYYDIVLKVKGARDEESVAMLDAILASRCFDIGYVYDNWKGASFIMQRLLGAKDTNFESHWASNEKAIMAHYGQVIELFESAVK